MAEGEASFRPYLAAEGPGGGFRSGAEVERLAAHLLARVVEPLREEFPRKELGTAARLIDYFERHDAVRRRELQHGWTSTEVLIAAVLATERGRAQSEFLGLAPPWERERLHPDRDLLAVRRNEDFAEAQQFGVTFLLREPDPDVCREGLRLLAACQTTPWSDSPLEGYRAARAPGEGPPPRADKARAYARGLVGHAAGVRLLQQGTVGPRQRAYAPSPSLDGRHGIDAGFHDARPTRELIELVAQFKGRERLAAPVVVRVSAGNVGAETTPIPVAVEERSREEQQLADWNRLVRGTARLRREYPTLVRAESLVGLYVEVLVDDPRTGEAAQTSSRPHLDSATGVYNAAFLEAARAAFAPLQTAIAEVRERRSETGPERPRRPLIRRSRP